MKSKTKVTKKAVSIRKAGTAPSPILRDAARHLMNTYKRSDMIFTHGRGCYVFDQNGKKYLDFLGGIAVNALGYSYPDLVKTIRREAGARFTSRICSTIRFRGRWRQSSRSGRTWTAYFSPTAVPRPSKAR